MEKIQKCFEAGLLTAEESVAVYAAIQIAARLMDQKARSHYGRRATDRILALADKDELSYPLQDNQW